MSTKVRANLLRVNELSFSNIMTELLMQDLLGDNALAKANFLIGYSA